MPQLKTVFNSFTNLLKLTQLHHLINPTMAKKRNLPLGKVYQHFEPGPVTLVTTFEKGRPNVMTMTWQTMIDFDPPIIGCVVSNSNYSFDRLRRTKQCVLNIPTSKLARKVVSCGTSSGRSVDKFVKFGLTQESAAKVKPPLVKECYLNLECKVIDSSKVQKYNLFILKGVKAWIDPQAENPKTLHHRGNGNFFVAGKKLRMGFRKK